MTANRHDWRNWPTITDMNISGEGLIEKQDNQVELAGLYEEYNRNRNKTENYLVIDFLYTIPYNLSLTL